jgi:intron-binding protein aquarius
MWNLAAASSVALCERALELLIDLVTQLPTRRFFLSVIEDRHVTVRCRLSRLSSLSLGHRFRQLVDMLRYYEDFEINSATGAHRDRGFSYTASFSQRVGDCG